MKKILNSTRGIGKVFVFTAKMMTSSKGWRGLTVAFALLCLLIPISVFAFTATVSGEEVTYDEFTKSITAIHTVDTTEGDLNLEALLALNEDFSDITVKIYPDYSTALLYAEEDKHSVVLHFTEYEYNYNVNLISTVESQASDNDISLLADFIFENFAVIQMSKSGITPEDIIKLNTPITVNITDLTSASNEVLPSNGTVSPDDSAREILGLILPYVTVMFMYFFVLFYGQSAAQLVVVEKTSKLMDTVLVSVSPYAMIFGKMLACVSCAFAQIVTWLSSIVIGFVLGGEISVKLGAETNIVREFLESDILEGVFTPATLILSFVMIVLGCILYCALASVGGALAGKQEDLQSTNMLFTLVLVASFLVTILGGTPGEGMITKADWTNWVPFTAVLVTPARILLGEISVLHGIASTAVIFLASALIMAIAGKLYKMMSFYKGNIPKIREIMGMLGIRLK